MLTTTIERLEGDTLRLDVAVPPEVVKGAFDDTLADLAKSVTMPGFRPGKVPPAAALARLGRDAVMAETVNHHLGSWYMSAVINSGIHPVGEPKFDFAELGGPDTGMSFSATVDVAPKPELPELASLEVEKHTMPDLSELVDEVIGQTLRAAGKLEATGAPAENGNEVVVDFTCLVDGEAVRGAGAVGYQARLGHGRLLEELEAAILGQEAGAELTVPVDFAADHPMDDLAGKHAEFKVTLREVSDVSLPSLDDAVAREVSEFDSAKALRDDVESGLRERVQKDIDGAFRGAAVAKLAEIAEVREPEALVQQRQNELYQDFSQRLSSIGMTIEAWSTATGTEFDKVLADLAQQARDDVRRELCLVALAEDLELAISDDDLRAEIREHVAHSGDDEQEAIDRIFGTGRADMLRRELLLQRTIDRLVESVKAVDGAPLPLKPEDTPVADDSAEEAVESEAEVTADATA